MIGARSVLTFPRTAKGDSEEYLEVSFEGLVNASFTIAIVERRMEAAFNSWMIGSLLPEPDSLQCDGVNPNANQGLAIGYGYPLKLDANLWGPNCDLEADVPVMGDRPNISVVTYSPQNGLTLFADGKQLKQEASEGLKRSVKGFIGRGFAFTLDSPGDSRYHGDLAEIVAFDIELSVEQRQLLEGYLRDSWAITP
jgi:hypothetical protein